MASHCSLTSMGTPDFEDAHRENGGSMAIIDIPAQNTHIGYLPDSILLHIFNYLPYLSVCRVSQACARWNRISKDELLWRSLFLRHFKLPTSTVLPQKARSWLGEFRRILYCTPVLLAEEIQKHGDEVLHISFSNNGKMFATCSKDGKFKIWSTLHWPIKLLLDLDMKALRWRYTQFSQFNESDTRVLVSGVLWERHTTKGEIVILNLEEPIDIQSVKRNINKPYDVFGAWYDNDHFLSGTIEHAGRFDSISKIWLREASRWSDISRPRKSLLYMFKNTNSSSVRLITVAEPGRQQLAESSDKELPAERRDINRNHFRLHRRHHHSHDHCHHHHHSTSSGLNRSNRASDKTLRKDEAESEDSSPRREYISHTEAELSCGSFETNMTEEETDLDMEGDQVDALRFASALLHGERELDPSSTSSRHDPYSENLENESPSDRLDYPSREKNMRCTNENNSIHPNETFTNVLPAGNSNLTCSVLHKLETSDVCCDEVSSRSNSSEDEDYFQPAKSGMGEGDGPLSASFLNTKSQHKCYRNASLADTVPKSDLSYSTCIKNRHISQKRQTGSEKFLVYTWGYKSYTPHMVGFKKVDMAQTSDSEPDLVSQPDHSIEFDGHIVGLCLSPDHRLLYVNYRPWPENYQISNPLDSPPVAQEVEIRTVDLSTFQLVGPVLRSHKAFTPSEDCFFLHLDVSEDYIVSGAEDKQAHLWDRHYSIPLYQFQHNDVVNSVAVNPHDPEMLVTVSDDHSIRVWVSRRKHDICGLSQAKTNTE